MSAIECVTCKDPKAALTCGVCESHICKACAQFASQDDVALLEAVPAYYEHGAFCQTCFDAKVQPELAEYNELLDRAQKIELFYKTQSKESRFIRRSEKPIRVKDCIDKEFAVMKMAFMAAKAGFNILLDVETSFDKIRNGGWQTSSCHGTAIPAHVDPDKLKRRFVGTST